MKKVNIIFTVLLLFVFCLNVAAAQSTIRIGVLTPTTGAFAALGQDGVEGTKLAFEQENYSIGGHPVQLFFEDSKADPNVAIQKARRLVERENVDIILGPLSGAEALAIKNYADRIPNTTIIVAGAASEDVTMRGIKDNVYRTAYTGAQVTFPLGKYAYNELNYRKVITIAEDYAFPYSQVGGFLSTFMLEGGKVADRFWVPIGTSDFSSIIAQIPKDIDAAYVCLSGTDGVNFLNQFKDFGLLDKIDILGGSTFVDATILESSGEILEGVISGSHYAQKLPYEEFKSFNKEFKDRVGRNSSLFAADYYIGAKVCIEALKAVDGKLEEGQEDFRNSLENVEMMTARGPFKFDNYHNVVLTSYITKVKKIDGEYKNVVIEEYENADQFGPFDPDWYQEQPPFDRTHPTQEYIENVKLK